MSSAAANDSLNMDKGDIITAMLSKLQGQEDTDFEDSSHLRLLERGVMKISSRQLKLGGRDREWHNLFVDTIIKRTQKTILKSISEYTWECLERNEANHLVSRGE